MDPDPEKKIKISGSGFGFDGSKILLSGFGFGHPEYHIFGADPERISDRIRIPDNNPKPTDPGIIPGLPSTTI